MPDPQDPDTFDPVPARLEGAQHTGLLAWYRGLISLRRQLPALTDPRLDRVRTEFDEAAGWLVRAPRAGRGGL